MRLIVCWLPKTQWPSSLLLFSNICKCLIGEIPSPSIYAFGQYVCVSVAPLCKSRNIFCGLWENIKSRECFVVYFSNNCVLFCVVISFLFKANVHVLCEYVSVYQLCVLDFRNEKAKSLLGLIFFFFYISFPFAI